MESLGDIASAVPDLIIEVPNRRSWFRIPPDELPKSLIADLDAWLTHDQGSDMRVRRARPQVPGRRRHMIKPRTAASYRTLMLEFIAMQVQGGVELASLRTLADVVALDNVDLGLSAYEQRFKGEKRPHLGQITRIICLVARHRVRVSQEHDSALWSWARDVSVPRHVMTKKNRDMLLALQNKEQLKRLLSLCRVIFDEILAKKRITYRDANRAQVAFVTALLLNAPARIGNISEIDIETNLRYTGRGEDQQVSLIFPADDVKNGLDLLFRLTRRNAQMLAIYRSRIRPVLLKGRRSPWLFPGELDGPKGFSLLSQQIASLTEQMVGVRITAHQFRHIVATILCQRSPNGLQAAGAVLGHRSLQTTRQIYAWLNREDAIKAWNELFAGLEEELFNADVSPARPRRKRS
jgi:integrase